MLHTLQFMQFLQRFSYSREAKTLQCISGAFLALIWNMDSIFSAAFSPFELLNKLGVSQLSYMEQMQTAFLTFFYSKSCCDQNGLFFFWCHSSSPLSVIAIVPNKKKITAGFFSLILRSRQWCDGYAKLCRKTNPATFPLFCAKLAVFVIRKWNYDLSPFSRGLNAQACVYPHVCTPRCHGCEYV